MKTKTITIWNVAFTRHYATITVSVAAIDADDATVLAENVLLDQYGIDVSMWSATADNTEQPAGRYHQ